MAAGKILLQKASGGVTTITGVDGTGATELQIPESGVLATTASPTFTGTVTAPTFSGALSGNATTATTSTNLAGGSLGTIPYQSASGTTAQLTAGTSGYYLKSNGAAAPSWSNISSFPSGTKMLFAQSSAPTGWTQSTTDTEDNRMLRVVKTAGGGVGGSSSPILNNVVPAHTHGFTTGTVSADHNHGGYTGGITANHSHPQNVTANANSGGPGYRTDFNADGSGYGTYPQGIQTGLQNSDHGHYITTGGASANHTHSGSTDNGSSHTNWTPRYLDLILCTKD